MLGALLAFAGAVLGSAVVWLGTRRATDVERDARRKEEWGRRFTAALEAATSADRRRRSAGRSLLVELSASALASEEDRRQADAVLAAIAVDVRDPTLRLVPPDQLNELVVLEDTGEDAEEEVTREPDDRG